MKLMMILLSTVMTVGRNSRLSDLIKGMLNGTR